MMACIFCFTRLSHGHPSKADGAICSRLDGKDTYCKLEQSQNAERSISLTPSGISMRFRFLHWLNVPEDIFFMPFSIKTPFKELHRLRSDFFYGTGDKYLVYSFTTGKSTFPDFLYIIRNRYECR